MIFSKPRTLFRPSRVTDGEGKPLLGYENSLSIERSKLLHGNSEIKHHTRAIENVVLDEDDILEENSQKKGLTQESTYATFDSNLYMKIIIRQKRGMSQKEIADELGIKRWTLRKLIAEGQRREGRQLPIEKRFNS